MTKAQQCPIRQYFGAGDKTPLENETDSDMDQPEHEHRIKDINSNTNNARNTGTPYNLTTKLLVCREGNNLNRTIESNIFCLLTNNVNGFNTINEGDKLLEELTILKELKVSAICFQETNKNWQKIDTYENIKKKLTKVWKKNKTIPSNMPDHTKSNFQPVGTATLVTDKWTSYICNSGKDKLGRLSYTTLKGKS
eukprot:4246147-Ditylum_brightwellii.AAC.1